MYLLKAFCGKSFLCCWCSRMIPFWGQYVFWACGSVGRPQHASRRLPAKLWAVMFLSVYFLAGMPFSFKGQAAIHGTFKVRTEGSLTRQILQDAWQDGSAFAELVIKVLIFVPLKVPAVNLLVALAAIFEKQNLAHRREQSRKSIICTRYGGNMDHFRLLFFSTHTEPLAARGTRKHLSAFAYSYHKLLCMPTARLASQRSLPPFLTCPPRRWHP